MSHLRLCLRLRGVHPFAKLFALAAFGLELGACEPGYSLEPTFCDDWCRATLKPSCNQSPSNCVRDCEQTRASGDCFARQEQLLACYERANDSDFVCTGGGFSLDTRVVGGVCQTERDQLFECEAPGIGVCLGLCRATQERQLEDLVASNPGLSSSAATSSDAGADACPLLDQPCEDLCWFLVTFAGSSLGAAGDPSAVPTGGSAGNDTVAAAGPAECLTEILLACYAEALPESSALPEASSEATPGVRTITEALEECSR